MPTTHVNGIDISYERSGLGDPVMLIVGLAGIGRGWGPQIPLFARDFTTVVPDHPGTGGSSAPPTGISIEEHAADLAELIRHLGLGPTHVVGSSTGGAIAQVMALDHADVVRTVTLVSSWARADDFFRHQFEVRKSILAEEGGGGYSEATALFLFSPQFFRDHYDQVRAWIETSGGSDPGVMTERIDMILAHDQHARLGEIDVPTLVVCGATDGCTPPYFSEELASLIPDAELAVMEGGHLIYKERPEAFHDRVHRFLTEH